MEKITAKLGAALYVCWGLLHFTAAYGIYKLAQNSPATMAQGRLMQTAFYLAAFAATAIVLALTLNWHSDRLGFWVNGVMVGIADIPFILFVLIPGYAPWWPGLLVRCFGLQPFYSRASRGWAPIDPHRTLQNSTSAKSLECRLFPS
ncbi:MAG: hypothetical protein WB772_11670 [Xanthobacteraceae bacterium]